MFNSGMPPCIVGNGLSSCNCEGLFACRYIQLTAVYYCYTDAYLYDNTGTFILYICLCNTIKIFQLIPWMLLSNVQPGNCIMFLVTISVISYWINMIKQVSLNWGKTACFGHVILIHRISDWLNWDPLAKRYYTDYYTCDIATKDSSVVNKVYWVLCIPRWQMLVVRDFVHCTVPGCVHSKAARSLDFINVFSSAWLCQSSWNRNLSVRPSSVRVTIISELNGRISFKF